MACIDTAKKVGHLTVDNIVQVGEVNIVVLFLLLTGDSISSGNVLVLLELLLSGTDIITSNLVQNFLLNSSLSLHDMSAS